MSERDDLVEQAYALPAENRIANPSRDRSVAAPKPRRVLVIDLDTGEWVSPIALMPGDSERVASSVLPGMPVEAVKAAYSDYLRSDVPQEALDIQGVIADGARGLNFLLQRQRDIEIHWNRQIDPDDPAAVSAYIRDVVLCATDELHEVLGEVNWKPWKDSRGIKDISKYREEMADVLHFILDLYLAGGLTGSDIILDYLSKNVTNLQRVKSAEYRAS